MNNLYDEVLKFHSLNDSLSSEEYYSIPFTASELRTVIQLLSENGHNVILNNIRVFLNEEYNIDYIPFYEMEE